MRQCADDFALHVLKEIVFHKLGNIGILDGADIIEAFGCSSRQGGEGVSTAPVVTQTREVELNVAQSPGRI